jgi:uncharacterized protein (DUF2267 family)
MTADGMTAEQAGQVIAAVLGTLRVLVPEEAADVASVLPSKLRALWETAGGVDALPPDGSPSSAVDGHMSGVGCANLLVRGLRVV